MKTKILALLLLLVFVVSAGCVAAAEDADASEELAIDDNEETVAVEQDETLAVDESAEPVAADEEDSSQAVAEDTDIQIDLDVPKTTYKMGDRVEVKVAVTNTGNATAKNVIVKLELSDYSEEMGSILEFQEGEAMTVDVGDDGAIQIHIDSIEPGKTLIYTIPFIAVGSGDVEINAGANGDNLATVDPGYVALTIEPDLDIPIDAEETAEAATAAAAAKSSELPATGNPLVLLALALLAIVPVYRRD